MGRPALEVADIFRAHGPAWREKQAGHLSPTQLKIMSAIEQCRTAALGGTCAPVRHLRPRRGQLQLLPQPALPQVPGPGRATLARGPHGRPAARRVLPRRLHPARPISALAYPNKAVIYRLLFDVAAETLMTIAADPKHLGARIGATLVLHTWGSAMTHHPHVHGIVPGGGLSPDGERWVACRRGFFLPVRVLSRLFRRRFIESLEKCQRAGQLRFFGEQAGLADARRLCPLAGTAAHDRVGGLCQAPVRRPRGGARLPVALYPSGGHLQLAARHHGRTATCPSAGRITGPRDGPGTRR
jgi:hypothetical protein